MALTGCTALAPQTVALRTGWPDGVTRKTEIADVPFFPQDEYQCGPAALATVLAHSGVAVTPEPLVGQVYLPARQGSLQVEMLAAPRRYGRVAYQLAPVYGDLLREVAAGNPVLVFQDNGAVLTRWHYAVVNGFDYGAGEIHLRSGTEKHLALPFTLFEHQWMKSGYWAMVTMPPDRIPVTATEDGWLKAVVAMERTADSGTMITAYNAVLKRWPGNLQASIGLANQQHARGALLEAAAVLRAALAAHPDSTIVMNNLAQTISDQGRQAEALAQIDQAERVHGPFATAVSETRQMILQRMSGHAGSGTAALGGARLAWP